MELIAAHHFVSSFTLARRPYGDMAESLGCELHPNFSVQSLMPSYDGIYYSKFYI